MQDLEGTHHLCVRVRTPDVSFVPDEVEHSDSEFSRSAADVEDAFSRLEVEHAHDGRGRRVRVDEVGVPKQVERMEKEKTVRYYDPETDEAMEC